MPLCPECGRLMSDSAPACDSCGYVFGNEKDESESDKATEELDKKFGINNPFNDLPDEEQKVSKAFTYVWRYPRATIRFLCSKNAVRSAYVFAAIGISANSLNKVLEYGVNSPTALSRLLLILTNIGAGVFFGCMVILIGGLVMGLVGTWFGSKAARSEYRICLGWSYAPYVLGFAVVLLLVVLAPDGFNIKGITNPGMFPASSASGIFGTLAIFYYTGLRGIMGIWSLVILVAGFSEVTGFSIIKSIGALILAFLITMIPVGTMLYLYSTLLFD